VTESRAGFGTRSPRIPGRPLSACVPRASSGRPDPRPASAAGARCALWERQLRAPRTLRSRPDRPDGGPRRTGRLSPAHAPQGAPRSTDRGRPWTATATHRMRSRPGRPAGRAHRGPAGADTRTTRSGPSQSRRLQPPAHRQIDAAEPSVRPCRRRRRQRRQSAGSRMPRRAKHARPGCERHQPDGLRRGRRSRPRRARRAPARPTGSRCDRPSGAGERVDGRADRRVQEHDQH
jgi:hypothetical protein